MAATVRLQMYAECPNEIEARRLLLDTVEPVLGGGTVVLEREVERYWKVTQWFGILLVVRVADRGPVDHLLSLGGTGWSRTRPGAPSAVWNPDGAPLLHPSVRWAHVEVLDGE